MAAVFSEQTGRYDEPWWQQGIVTANVGTGWNADDDGWIRVYAPPPIETAPRLVAVPGMLTRNVLYMPWQREVERTMARAERRRPKLPTVLSATPIIRTHVPTRAARRRTAMRVRRHKP